MSVDGDDLAPVVALKTSRGRAGRAQRMAGLVREWLADVKVMGRSEQTIKWYRQKVDWYLGHEGGPAPPSTAWRRPRSSGFWAC